MTNKIKMNNILRTDSYKFSHYLQYPKHTTDVFSYIESRGCKFTDELMFFGLQAYLKEYLSNPVTMEDVEFANKYCASRFLPFNYEGWKYIVEKHNGYLPLTIKSAKEGAVIPLHNVLLTIHTSDSNLFWLPSYVETALLRAIWYPSTVATISYTCKKIMHKYLLETSDQTESLNFMLHDFGARGVSSGESAMLGGMGHIINFFGTDTDEAVIGLMNYYDADLGANTASIPAAEHSTITSWGRDHEFDAYSNMVDQYAHEGSIFAVVADSYNIYNAVENMWSKGGLFDRVKAAKSRVVIRPDSGDALTVPIKIVQLIADLEGYTVNSKGYKVLPDHIRVIQGDGITIDTIPVILENLKNAGFSAECLNFGMGGGLLQHSNRDTFQFAQKCCAALVDGHWVDVYKQPIDGNGKKSKAGRMTLIKNNAGDYETIRLEDPYERKEELEIVFKHGILVKETNIKEIRQRANEYFAN